MHAAKRTLLMNIEVRKSKAEVGIPIQRCINSDPTLHFWKFKLPISCRNENFG